MYSTLPIECHAPSLKYPVQFVIDRITPTAKAAAKRAGNWRAAAGELLQVVEPVPSPNAHTNERSRIAAVRIFGKPNNRPTSAGLFCRIFFSFLAPPARMQSHPLQHEASTNMRKPVVGFHSNWGQESLR